jgi:predicted ATPase
MAFALAVRCRTKCLLLDDKGLSQDVEELHALASDHSLEFFLVLATNYGGWAKALEGRTAEAIALLERGVEGVKAAGAQWHYLFHGSILAAAYQRTGRIEDGLALIDSLLEVAERTGVRYVDADLYRVRGELLVSSPTPDAAEAALQRGLTISRDQQARIFEIRIATSLARIWCKQGRARKARQLLAPICGWFGDATSRDLETAKKMLLSLG